MRVQNTCPAVFVFVFVFVLSMGTAQVLGSTVTNQISMLRESYTENRPITATYTVDHDAETFEMELQVPKEYEWIGMHLVSMDFGAAIPCIRQDGETFCTEGVEFYMNNVTSEVTMKFTHTTRFIPDTSTVPEASGVLFDCQPVQQDAGVCSAGEAIIATASFGFTAARLPQTEADFELLRGELVEDVFHIKWRRSLERPLDGPTLMIRSAAKPRAYQDSLRRVAMGMPYHGYGATNTQTIQLVESNAANDDAANDEPADQCPPSTVRAFSRTGMGADAVKGECATFCTPVFVLSTMPGNPTEGSCKDKDFVSFLETRSVDAGGPQPVEVAIYVRAANNEPADQCPPSTVRAYSTTGMGADAAKGECATFCTPVFALPTMPGSPTEGSCKDKDFVSFLETRSVAAGGPQPVEVAIYGRASSDEELSAGDAEPSQSAAAPGASGGPMVTLSALALALALAQLQ